MSFQQAFDELLTAWRSHEQLRDEGATFDQLVDSKIRLDRARHATHVARNI